MPAEAYSWANMDTHDTTLSAVTQGYQSQEVTYQVPLSAYPTATGVIIVNAPGAGEPKDGRDNRYAKIGGHLQDMAVGTLVTHRGPLPDAQSKYPDEPYSYRDASWNRISVEAMVHVIDYCKENAQMLCGSSSPTIHLAGFSAGGSVCGAVAFAYPEVSRILLLSTYDSVGDYFYSGMRKFAGEVYLAYGSEDTMAGFLAYAMNFTAPELKALNIKMVPDCDHGFRGATNGRILSKAFLWAFAGDESFPSPLGGIDLYNE